MLMFRNPGEIDFRLITTLGVNVKDSDTPIGFFGTGLKYAIAGLLRAGETITIWSGLTKYTFKVEPQSIRGKEFGFIKMQSNHDIADLPLGFTIDLGKTWETWMFYRELASNVMDEHGTIEQGDFMNFEPTAGGQTIVIVSGLDKSHRDRGEIFLQTKPFATSPGELEIHRRDPANGLANCLYYRGVRVAQLQSPTRFNYNIIGSLGLTEDRTIKHLWDAAYHIARGIIAATGPDNLKEIESILLAPSTSFESQDLDFDRLLENSAFDGLVERLMERNLGRLNQSALKRIRSQRAIAPLPAQMTKIEQRQLALALEFLRDVLHVEVESPIVVSDSLGEGILGLASKGQIFLSRRAFAQGTKQVAIVLVEEWLHAERGLDDYSREFQTWTLEKMVTLGEELQGKPL